MVLECEYGSFSRVALVGKRRQELLVTFTFLRYYTAVLLDGLVVKYLKVYLVATLMEADRDALVDIDAVEVLLGLEVLD